MSSRTSPYHYVRERCVSIQDQRDMTARVSEERMIWALVALTLLQACTCTTGLTARMIYHATGLCALSTAWVTTFYSSFMFGFTLIRPRVLANRKCQQRGMNLIDGRRASRLLQAYVTPSQLAALTSMCTFAICLHRSVSAQTS